MKEPIIENAIYTIEEAAELLVVSAATIRRYIKRGKLKAGTIGGRYRIPGQNLLELVGVKTKAKKT